MSKKKWSWSIGASHFKTRWMPLRAYWFNWMSPYIIQKDAACISTDKSKSLTFYLKLMISKLQLTGFTIQSNTRTQLNTKEQPGSTLPIWRTTSRKSTIVRFSKTSKILNLFTLIKPSYSMVLSRWWTSCTINPTLHFSRVSSFPAQSEYLLNTFYLRLMH